jgi:hypothetical protein
MAECSCDVRPPRREANYERSISGYAIYLDTVEDDTRFDPACPFHGDDGTMVAVLTDCSHDEREADRG